MYFVYIIETEDGQFYTGQTKDLARRLREHMTGVRPGAVYLRMHRPKYLVYLEACPDRSTAIRREREIKRNRHLKMSLVGTRRDLNEVIETEKEYLRP